MGGFVYVMTNPSLKGMVKIGYTLRSPDERAAELSGTSGIPTPFKVAYSFECDDPEAVEQRLHNRFASTRVNFGREFFRLSVGEVIEALAERNDVATCSNARRFATQARLDLEREIDELRSARGKGDYAGAKKARCEVDRG